MIHCGRKNKWYNDKGLAEDIRSIPSNVYHNKLCKSFSISYGLNRFHPSPNEKRHRFLQKSREGPGFSNFVQTEYAFILLDCHVETALFSKFIPFKLRFIFLILKAMTGKKRINAFKNN